METQPNGSSLRKPAKAAEPPTKQPDLDIDLHLQDGSTPDGWTPGQWARVRRQSTRIAELEAALKTAEGGGTRVAELEGQVATLQRRYDSDVTMLGSGLPQLADPEVRGFVAERYGVYAASAGEKAQPFADWFKGQAEKPSPILAPFLAKPVATTTTTQDAGGAGGAGAGAQGQGAAQGGGAGGGKPTQPPNPTQGTGQPTGAGAGGLTAEQIASASQNVASFNAQKATIKAQLEAKYGVRIGSGK